MHLVYSSISDFTESVADGAVEWYLLYNNFTDAQFIIAFVKAWTK